MRRGGLPRSGLWLAAPKAVQSVRGLSLPSPDSGAPIEQLAQAEAMRVARLEPGAFELALWRAPAPHRGEGMHATAVIVRHDELRSLFEGASACGLTVEGVTPQAAAATLGVSNGLPGLCLVADLGWSDTTFVAVHDGRPAFQRSASQSLRGVAESLAGSLGLGVAEAVSAMKSTPEGPLGEIVGAALRRYGGQLAEEIESSLGFLRSVWPGRDADRVLLVGGGARTVDLDDWLVASLGIDTRRARPVDAEYTAAVGAAHASAGLGFRQPAPSPAEASRRAAA